MTASTMKMITNHFAIDILIPATPLAPTTPAIIAKMKNTIASWMNPPENCNGNSWKSSKLSAELLDTADSISVILK